MGPANPGVPNDDRSRTELTTRPSNVGNPAVFAPMKAVPVTSGCGPVIENENAKVFAGPRGSSGEVIEVVRSLRGTVSWIGPVPERDRIPPTESSPGKAACQTTWKVALRDTPALNQPAICVPGAAAGGARFSCVAAWPADGAGERTGAMKLGVTGAPTVSRVSSKKRRF